MIKQLKDRKHIEAIIKITKIREVFKINKSLTSFKDKLIHVNIDKKYGETSTCFIDNKKGHKELLKFIKEELYL